MGTVPFSRFEGRAVAELFSLGRGWTLRNRGNSMSVPDDQTGANQKGQSRSRSAPDHPHLGQPLTLAGDLYALGSSTHAGHRAEIAHAAS